MATKNTKKTAGNVAGKQSKLAVVHNDITLTINGCEVTTGAGTTILRAAEQAGIYIPFLCAHPDLVPTGKCQLCIVKVDGMTDFPLACEIEATQGMVVTTETPELENRRQEALAKILVEHPHGCLDCWRRMECGPSDTCHRVPTVSPEERCVTCSKNGHCEFQRLVDYIGIDQDIPYNPKEYTVIRDNPFFERNYNLCVMCGRCVHMCKDIRGVGVYAFDNDDNPTLISTVNGGSVKDSGCKFCLACVEVCPTGAIMDIEMQKLLSNREAYVIPCSNDCPAHIDVPRYVRYVAQSKYNEALAVIREKVPFPGTLGRVCKHPCEEACRRSKLNDPVSIKELKRVAAERGDDLWRQNSRKAKSSGRRVAVVGSGPAGLTAGFYLAKAGHSVTVFEALSQPGGMMRVGIPEYRLPKNILATEIKEIKAAGVKIKLNTKVDSIDALFEQGFEAIFVAVGAHRGAQLRVDGETAKGMMDGISFLRDVSLGKKVNIGKQVVVIGGGNVAIDASRTALRLKAEKVDLLCLESESEMPAFKEEIEAAVREGVNLNCSWGVEQINVTGDGQVAGVECKECTAVFDASGQFNPTYCCDVKTSLSADTIILAIGQAPDIPVQFGLNTIQGNRVQVDPRTLQTSREGVFAGGDAVSGIGSVIEAIAMARQAACAIDKYLGGSGVIDETLAPVEETDGYLGKDEEFADRKRVETHLISSHDQLESFAEDKTAFTPEEACEEAGRCLQCDLRLKITPVVQAPQEFITYTIKVVRPRSGRSNYITTQTVISEQAGTSILI